MSDLAIGNSFIVILFVLGILLLFGILEVVANDPFGVKPLESQCASSIDSHWFFL